MASSDAIKKITGREILDSRGNPTIESTLQTVSGATATFGVPSGASTGSHEACELRDGGRRHGGKGVLTAVSNINMKIRSALVGKSVFGQGELDVALLKLDGTENKTSLGANAILGASAAATRAAAMMNDVPLYQYVHTMYEQKHGKRAGGHSWVMPCPQMNVLNGGRHAGMEHDVQETMLMPVGAKSFSEALQIGAEIYHSLKTILKKKYGATATLVGDEGGFAPVVGAEGKLELLSQAITQAGYEKEAAIGIDAAASEFFENGAYNLGGNKMGAGELVDFYSSLCSKYRIISIEDGLAEDDWPGWAHFNSKLGKKIQIVGDDLLTTNTKRITRAVSEKSCNALLLKINQIGTITESLDAAALAMKNGWKVVVSHRSGETNDSFISDLAVGLGCGQIKPGAPARGERVAKYNRLLEIEEELLGAGKRVSFGGKIFASK
ncbi:MAG: phosphopyruvate hydratase [Candidatus Micrarchaeia archaeon]